MALTKKYVSGATLLSALALALFVLFAPSFVFAFGVDVTSDLSLTATTSCISTFPVSPVSYTNIRFTGASTSVYPSGTNLATFTGGPTHTCANNYTYSIASHFTSGDGFYSINNWQGGFASSTNYYAFVKVESGVIVDYVFPVESTQNIYNTRFTDTDLTTSTSSGSTTLSFNVDYLIDLTEVNENDPKFYPSQVRVVLAKRPSINDSAIAESILPLTSTGTVDVEFDDVPDGTYDFLVNFSNYATVFDITQKPFDRSYVYGSVTISGGSITNVALDPLYNALTPPSEQKRACSITELDGCLYNGFSSLFVPSQVSLDNFYNLNLALQSKFPFAYAYDLTSAMTTLYSTAQTATSTITVPFASFGNITLISKTQIQAVPYSATIKQLLGWLMWIAFAYLMYYKTLRIFNPSSQ